MTAFAAIVAATHLAWEFTHGGVRAHHLLNDKSLPALSNWWGIVVLPLLAWLATRSAQRRGTSMKSAAFAAAGAALLGAALSAAFIGGVESLSFALLLAVLLSGLVLPTHRPEYLFGFVLGMLFTFGAVLPMIVGVVAAGLSLIMHRAMRPAAAWTFARLRR